MGEEGCPWGGIDGGTAHTLDLKAKKAALHFLAWRNRGVGDQKKKRKNRS